MRLRRVKRLLKSGGGELAGTLSKYFFSRRKDNPNTTFLAERFVFNNVSDVVENILDHVVQNDLVGVVMVLFKETVSSKDFFKDKELNKLLFPDVANVEKLFEYYM